MLTKKFFDTSSLNSCQQNLIQTSEEFSNVSQQHVSKQIRFCKPTPEQIRSNRSQIKKRLSLSFPLIKGVNFSLDQKTLISTASSLKQIVKKDKINIKFFTEKKLQEVEESFLNYDQESFTFAHQDFDSNYQLMNKIGQGAHSSVYKCRNTETGEFFAVKITRKVDEQLKNRMIKQYKLLKILNNRNILKVHELIYNHQQQKLYTISQLCQYPDLRHQIIRRKQFNLKFSEQQILMLLQQILKTLKYIHSAGISHRDIKPQNILYNPNTRQIKLIDFDVSKEKYFKNQDFFMWTNTGTLHYRAPQTFNLGYSQKIDIWSIGILLYQLFTGQVPFNSTYQRQTMKKIKNQTINYQNLRILSKTKYLIKKMLQKQPQKRYSCYECLAYLNNQFEKSKDDLKVVKTPTILAENKCFQAQDIQSFCLSYKIKMDFLDWKISIIQSQSSFLSASEKN